VQLEYILAILGAIFTVFVLKMLVKLTDVLKTHIKTIGYSFTAGYLTCLAIENGWIQGLEVFAMYILNS
jgi:hypothetical protein